ncbi:MAG: TetR family transcriptional regulator [Pseudomonadota bacterium]|nr:TetR family transcriptional regulator [Pseudomonadota bacterium]
MAVPDETRERILDAAEALFADHGFADTSLRAITGRAGVNLAAVNYHFGSKEALIQEVFVRRLGPLNREQLRRLARLEEAGCPALEQVLEAFIAPAMELYLDAHQGGARFIRLLGRTYVASSLALRDFIHHQYSDVLERFLALLRRVLPQLPEQELCWRMHFLLGAVSYTLGGTDIMKITAGCDLCDPADNREVLERLIPFLAAGFRAVPAAAVT